MNAIVNLLILIICMNSPIAQAKKFQVEVLTDQDDVIWGFDFLDQERIIFTERDGKFRILNINTKAINEVEGAPEVRASGQGGLLDVRVHPKQRTKIFYTFSEPTAEGATTTLASATLVGNKLNETKKIFVSNASNSKRIHFGSRIEFDDKGLIYVTIGDRDSREKAQDLSFHNGKIVRLNEDGGIPKDNPFVNTKGAKPEIWSYGHRSPQGLVRHPKTGDLWMTEMGPRGGDELNLVKAGANYGWPVVTFGREYIGGKIGEGTSKPGMEDPVAHWVPSISPSGTTIYDGKAFPNWVGDVFIGNLSSTHLRRLKLDGRRVVEQEILLKDEAYRIRNVRTGPDGFLYLSTDDGKIVRLKN